MKQINIVLMRGLLGNVYSRGMDTLGAKLAKLPGVDYLTVEDYTAWRSIRDRVARWRDPTVLIGHSFGANAATVIAGTSQGVPFPLIVTVDPSQWWSWWLLQAGPDRIGLNVAHAVNFFQRGFPIGNVKLAGHDVENIPIDSTHIQIDDLPLVHDATIAEVKKVIGA